MILYQMLYGVRPFGQGVSQQKVLSEGIILQARAVSFPAKPAVSAEAREFIRRCLTYDAFARPDVLSICKDPYLQTKK